MQLCVQCACRGTACCQARDIFVTTADILRIYDISGAVDFYEYRRPLSADYLDQNDDPDWNMYTVQLDGSRRVLKQGPMWKCIFLAENGCRLPLAIRPLVCRLHPVEYTEQRITGLASECPSELLPDGVGLLENLCMNLAEAEKWRLQLYAELKHDWTTQPKAA